jgi:predicted metal-dependent hydrolase
MPFTSTKLNLDWEQDLPKYWFDSDPVKTHFFNSLSICFTGRGEIAFIDAVRGTMYKIKNPDLYNLCTEFVKQEAQHTRVHKQYNTWLDTQGLPATAIEQEAFDHYQANKHRLSTNTLLIITACQEHNTSVLAEFVLGNEIIINQMHPHFRQIWLWHAVEELEHRSVVFDLMHESKIRAPYRLLTIILTIMLMIKLLKTTCVLLYKDRELFKFRTIKSFVSLFFNRKTGLINALPLWLRIMKTNFHPSKYNTKLLEQNRHIKDAS